MTATEDRERSNSIVSDLNSVLNSVDKLPICDRNKKDQMRRHSEVIFTGDRENDHHVHSPSTLNSTEKSLIPEKNAVRQSRRHSEVIFSGDRGSNHGGHSPSTLNCIEKSSMPEKNKRKQTRRLSETNVSPDGESKYFTNSSSEKLGRGPLRRNSEMSIASNRKTEIRHPKF
jgi:hypothetical protein